MKKIILVFSILSIIILAFGFVYKNNEQQKISKDNEHKKIKIATCPTCFELVENINTEKYEIIKTKSTAESMELLKYKQVDMILSGRTLKPHEPQMDSLPIRDGYSFLNDKEMTIYINQLNDKTIYTDLDIESIKNNIPAEKIKRVNNVYDYLDRGIVITSWDNTDYTRAKIVHVFETNGERFGLSRRPTIYCPNICGQEAQEIALLTK